MFDRMETIPWGTDLTARQRQRTRAKWDLLITGELLAAAGAVALTHLLAPPVAIPAMASPLSNRVLKAMEPVTDLITALSYPLGLTMMSAGGLLMMAGQRQKGLQFIKLAAVGYLVLQFTPALFSLVVDVGRAMREAVTAP